MYHICCDQQSGRLLLILLVIFLRGGKVLCLETTTGSKLPDRYKIGKLLKNGPSKVICFSSGNAVVSFLVCAYYLTAC